MDFLDQNLQFIESHRNLDLAKKKSAEVLKLLVAINEKLSGIMRRRKSNPYDVEEECYILNKIKRNKKWLYDKNGSLHSTSSISKFELDENIYGQLQKDKNIYVRLGFKETEEDSTAEAFEQIYQLDERNKRLLLKQLARELGMKVSDKDADDEGDIFTGEEDGDDVFDGETWVSDAFPVSRVRNMESLVEHVKQQFFCADPVRYEKVLRQIRVSKSPRMVRAYVGSMYMNDSDVKICQICKKPVWQMEVTEIANFGIELPQLNLCLCRECSGIYKSMRDVNKDAFKEGIKQAILGLNPEEKSEEYEIEFNENTSLYFTETHVAEIQTIFGLLSEFGTPGVGEETEPADVSEPEEVESETDERFKNRQADTLIYREQDTQQTFLPEMEQTSQMEFTIDFTPNMQSIKDGDLVSYKKMNTLEIVDYVMDSTKYPLHKSFIGKKIGDVVVANGKRFLIVSIL